MSAESLARSKPVRRFMVRILDEHRDPETGNVYASTLAIATANTFKLYEDDGTTIASALIEVPEQLALDDGRGADACPAGGRIGNNTV